MPNFLKPSTEQDQPRLESGTVFEEAVRTLEEEIVLGFLNPRERLTEDELLARFKMKRHVVRQVLVELEQMGLLERRRNIGAVIKSYSVKEVEDLYAVRELLECHCARIIKFPVEQGALDKLNGVQYEHDAMVKSGNLRGVFRANMRFHQLLFGLSDNPILVDAIQHHALRAHGIRSSSLLSPQLVEKARKEHWKMLEAIEAGDRETLVNLCRDHLTPSRDTYLATQLRRAEST